jgi:hypothetical protein
MANFVFRDDPIRTELELGVDAQTAGEELDRIRQEHGTLEPGTVVELGGVNEITRSTQDLSENVFGVISTRPAYTMNGGAGENDTHPPVAMTGRVPVKCVGVVRKGDRLVSAGDGVARAAQPGEATAFNVIGRSLDNKTTMDIGTIEAIVTIK